MRYLLRCVLVSSLLAGCVPANYDDGFRAQKPVSRPGPGSATADTAADTVKREVASGTSSYGFQVEVSGPVELHFYDEEGRHTGPATAQEYLPVLEAALRNPSLHEQERAGLERMREQIKRTGSAAGLAITRRIPNLDYRIENNRIFAVFPGSGELDMRIAASDYALIQMTLRLWDREKIRTAVYSFSAGLGQEGGMDIGAQMDDLTLSWDENGDGEPDRDISPNRIDVVGRR